MKRSERVVLESEIVSVSIRPKNLREVRADSGMTLKELSEKCGLSTGFLNDLEFRRRTCSQENFMKIADAFDTKILRRKE